MRRVLLAMAAATVMAASFAAVTAWRADAPPAAGEPPVAAGPPEPAAPARAVETDPVPAPPVEALEPEIDPDAFLETAARAAEAREEAERRALLSPSDGDESLDVRLDAYRLAMHRALSGTAREGFLDHPSLLAEAFLRRPDVQRELAALSPGARRRELAHIRRELGYEEEEVAAMAELDARREARWENGRAYMEERRRATATFEDEALEEEIDHLRLRYFAHEAGTIEAEERDGFFRYERPRIYGRN